MFSVSGVRLCVSECVNTPVYTYVQVCAGIRQSRPQLRAVGGRARPGPGTQWPWAASQQKSGHFHLVARVCACHPSTSLSELKTLGCTSTSLEPQRLWERGDRRTGARACPGPGQPCRLASVPGKGRGTGNGSWGYQELVLIRGAQVSVRALERSSGSHLLHPFGGTTGAAPLRATPWGQRGTQRHPLSR